MSLTTKFVTNFQRQIEEFGLQLHRKDNLFYAGDGKTYISLRLLQEYFPMSKVTMFEVVIVVGNFPKDMDNILIAKLDENLEEIENSSFFYKPLKHGQHPDLNVCQILNDLISLRTMIYHCQDFVALKQLGTYDLVLKNPLCIEALKGNVKFSTIIEKLNEINIPYGWFIQKPKGLGKESVYRFWKVVACIIPILLLIVVLCSILFRNRI